MAQNKGRRAHTRTRVGTRARAFFFPGGKTNSITQETHKFLSHSVAFLVVSEGIKFKVAKQRLQQLRIQVHFSLCLSLRKCSP